MNAQLNRRTSAFVGHLYHQIDDRRIATQTLPNGGRILDFGVDTEGGLAAGIALARACMSDLADIQLVRGTLGERVWPYVQVQTDHPTAACLFSQYAGWQMAVGKYFGMGSGPMRAAAAREELFAKLDYRETDCESTVGILESGQLPTADVFAAIAEKIGIAVDRITLLVAPTASAAGNLQVVARSIETSLHKLFELGFDVRRISSGFGTAPLPPVAKNDLSGIGRTNDAILYGGSVTLMVHGDDESLAQIGPHVPADSSDSYGQPFLDIFEEAGRDFYKIDPHLFSPAEVIFQNLDTGRVHQFGRLAPDIVRTSFGLQPKA